MSPLLYVWMLTLALVGASPPASGFPGFDPGRERIIEGRVLPHSPAMIAKALTRGSWERSQDRLRHRERDGRADSLWFPKRGTLSDGLVRARLVPGSRFDLSVMFRVQLDPKNLATLSGYGLSIDKKTLRFHRWDRGVVLPMGPAIKVPKLYKRRSLEVVLYLVGPQMVALVFDGDKLDHLATLTIRDTTYKKGRIGLRAGPKQDKTGGLSLLSMMESEPIKHGSIVDPTPFGNTRFAFIDAAEADKLPSDLQRNVKQKLKNASGELEAVLFLDTVELERLRRTGVGVRAIDSNVPWKTFDPAYRKHSTAAPKRSRRGFALDLSYKNPRMVEDLLRGYHERYPDITRLVELGRTHQGRAIMGLKISDNAAAEEDEPAVLLNGAHHGSELLTIEYVLDAVAQLLEGYERDRDVRRWVDNLEIWCVPLVNADGTFAFLELSRFAARKNGRGTRKNGQFDPFLGVDLNRNYPFGWGKRGSSSRATSKYYRGPSAGSEPETRALMKLADEHHFAASISFHTVGTALFTPYVVEGAVNPKPDIARVVAEEILADAPTQPNGREYHVGRTYAVAGADQDWHRHEHGTLAYVLEGSHHNPRSMKVRNLAVAATRPVWKTLLDRIVDGPRISGHVVDPNGKPLEAEVMITQVATRAGERWTSRPRDGRFDRLLEGPGRYTVRASLPCGTVTKRVYVQTRRTIDLVIPGAGC